MGTLLNGSREVFRTIVEAAYAPGRQIVLSIGAHLTSEELGTVPPNAIVVNHAPQLEILQRAHLCITHGGLNTVLEALAQGVPLVAIPVAYDQPGVAARIKHSRTGLYTPLHQLPLKDCGDRWMRYWTDPVYREQAQRLQNVYGSGTG